MQQQPKKIHISFSQLDTLATCPQMWYRRYILKEPQVVTGALILGRAFHKAMEANFKFKLESKIDLEKNKVAKVFRECFDEEASKPKFMDLDTLTENQVDWGNDDPKDLRELGQRALLRYHQKHAPFLEPLMVEERFEKEVMPGVLLVGYIDLITVTGTVIDYKLVNYPWKADKVELAMQPTVYSLLLDSPINFDFHFITKNTKGVGISVRRTTRTTADTDWLLNIHIPQAVEMIRKEMFIRSPGLPCTWCSYRLGCGYRIS